MFICASNQWQDLRILASKQYGEISTTAIATADIAATATTRTTSAIAN